MKSNRKFLLPCFACVLSATSGVHGGVTFTQIDAADNSVWASSFGGGDLAFSTRAATLNSSVGESITAAGTNMMGQSFRGNGQALQGWGFFGNGGNSVPLTYRIVLFDYGTGGPVDTYAEFNPTVPAVKLVDVTFELGGSVAKKQMLFDFFGGDTVVLEASRYYSISIVGPAGSSMTLHRLGGAASTYADGTGAKGANLLNPDAFAGAGNLRDSIFALYTAPAAVIPEPSSFAVFAGAAALTLGGLRRRRSLRS